jgi:hypothetical protein
MLVARVSSRGSSTMRCAPAACGAAEAAVFANVVAFDELLNDLGAERLFLKLSLAGSLSVLAARGDVASSVGCPTACRAVGATVFANVFAFGEALDDLGAGPLMLVEVVVVRLMLSSVRVACSDVASFGCPAI